jgi:hypothetical protein
MDNEVQIANHPSVKLNLDHYGKHGKLNLCSVYGNYSKESSISVPDGDVVRIHCPHCEANLGSSAQCVRCGAPMASMQPNAGGTIQICTRVGCTKHHVEFENLDSELEAFYQSYRIG